MAVEEIEDGPTGTAPNPEDGASHRCRVVAHDRVTDKLGVVWTDLKPVGMLIRTWIARNDFKPDPSPPRD